MKKKIEHKLQPTLRAGEVMGIRTLQIDPPESAHVTLDRIIRREAHKLDAVSSGSEKPLDDKQLEALEALSKCARNLQKPQAVGRPIGPNMGVDLDADLELAGS